MLGVDFGFGDKRGLLSCLWGRVNNTLDCAFFCFFICIASSRSRLACCKISALWGCSLCAASLLDSSSICCLRASSRATCRKFRLLFCSSIICRLVSACSFSKVLVNDATCALMSSTWRLSRLLSSCALCCASCRRWFSSCCFCVAS
jgi:hypothetical protein